MLVNVERVPRSDRGLLRVLWLAAVGLVAGGCAPLATLRPLAGLGRDRDAEVGAAMTAVGPRPYVDEPWRGAAQLWGSLRATKALELSAVTAFDTEAFALGGAARLAFVQSDRVALGGEVELGWLWGALALHASLRIADEWRLYTAPRIGNWGDDWAPGIPVGLNAPLFGGLALRVEGQVNWAAFEYYNRRVLGGAGLAYQW